MATRTDKGCGTPSASSTKDLHRRLLDLFSPLVYFDSGEQFFPVDLPSTVTASELWELDRTVKPVGANRRKAAGQINDADLTGANRDHHTTVAGAGSIPNPVDPTGVVQPVPQLKQVLQAYTGGSIAAELTMYGMVCTARDVPGASVVLGATAADKDVAHGVQEGLLLTYSFYFPYRHSPEFESEGDWSGVVLLLRETPSNIAQISSASELKRFLPVVTCYFTKTEEGAPPSPHFVAGTQGFRRWKDVSRGHESSVGLDTHPKVYITRGRHNCRYSPGTTKVQLSPPWPSSSFTPDGIEKGGYAPGPAVNTLEGGGIEDFPWWGYALFPPFAALVACATGCEHPVQFDSSGVASDYQEGDDLSDDKGYDAKPAATGSSHPTTPAGSATGTGATNLSIRMRYVDLDDATTAAQWGFPGAWGAATMVKGLPLWGTGISPVWGEYQGARRPILPAWFMWNLFLDRTFGCKGNPQLTRSPF